jgi:hypothetical protein
MLLNDIWKSSFSDDKEKKCSSWLYFCTYEKNVNCHFETLPKDEF